MKILLIFWMTFYNKTLFFLPWLFSGHILILKKLKLQINLVNCTYISLWSFIDVPKKKSNQQRSKIVQYNNKSIEKMLNSKQDKLAIFQMSHLTIPKMWPTYFPQYGSILRLKSIGILNVWLLATEKIEQIIIEIILQFYLSI